MMSPPRAQYGRSHASSIKARTVSFGQASRRHGVEVRADDMMPNADVGLVHSGKNTRRRDGTAKRRLDRAAQRGLADATQVRK